MRAAMILSVLLWASLSPSPAQPPLAPTARGLAIYKSSAFRPDSAAVLLEYLSQKNHPRVTYFLTPKGRRITVSAGKAEVLFLPYPGQGEATPEQAFALLAIARKRFPQFQTHYAQYDRAWRQEAKRPAAQIAAEISRRQANESSASDFAEGVREAQPRREPPDLPKNPLGPTRLNPAPTPAPEPPAETTEPEPQDLEGSLKKLEDFYRLSGQLQDQGAE